MNADIIQKIKQSMLKMIKELKSIVIDLKKDEVTYRKGNHLENLKKKEGVSENNYPKIAKFSKDMKQYAKKKKYELMS